MKAQLYDNRSAASRFSKRLFHLAAKMARFNMASALE